MADNEDSTAKGQQGRETHTGWTSRGYLPHFDAPHVIQGLTFRLADSLPKHVVQAMAEDTDLDSDAKRRAKIEAYLNAGYGACYLRDHRVAKLVEEALLHFDGRRYQMIAWVIMPNHVHVVIQVWEGFPVRNVVQSWKSFTAKQANKVLRRSGPFWFVDYFDRYIRDGDHFASAIAYVHDNPVVAGLVESAREWPYSSARFLPG